MNLPMFKMIMVRMTMAILFSLMFLISAPHGLGQHPRIRIPERRKLPNFTIIYLVPNPADELDSDIKGRDRYRCQPDGQEILQGWRLISSGIKRAAECSNKMDELVKQESNAPVPPKPVETQPVSETSEPEEIVPETPAALDAEAVSALLDDLIAGLSEFTDAEDDIARIFEKWEARENLAGQPKKRVLELLFKDVQSVIADEEIRKVIWSKWNSD